MDMFKELSEQLQAQGDEIDRFMRASAAWSVRERVRVLIAWMGTARAREMNDFLEKRD